MKLVTIFIVVFIFTLTSCFEKDSVIPLQELNGDAFVFSESIYTHQFFYDLGSNKIVSQNLNNKWDLSFDCRKTGFDIRINSGNLLLVWASKETDFNTTNFSTIGRKWLFDKSDGNADSLAISGWVNTKVFPYTYSNEVFIIGQYDGINYNPLKKLQFYSVTDTSYSFKYANLDGTSLKDVSIKKDTLYNSIFFDLANRDTVYIEPPKKNWDLLFTQYATTLYTEAGIAVPYYVRGTLINRYTVKACLDSVNSYTSINLNSITESDFSTNVDIIGYNWKSVEVNAQANSAIYTVRAAYNYIIEDTEGEYYKLKFISFFNATKSPGYPSFILNKLK